MRTSPIILEDFDPSSRFADFDDEASGVDVEAIEREAYERGFEEGRREAETGALAASIKSSAAALKAIAADLVAGVREAERRNLAYVEQVLSAVLPSLAATAQVREGAAFIERTIRELSSGGSAPPLLRVRAPADAAAALSEAVEAAGAADQAAVFPDPDMPDGAVEIAWENGGASLDLAGAAEGLLASLKTALNLAEEEDRHEQ